MQYFLLISSLVFSLNSLGSNSCKDQKKLLKSTCSFKKEKIKSKNLPSLNSCKKIKDLFLDLKTKTKENYESCEKAYEKCTENCNRCNKSLVSKFKEKSKKNLKKIKRGFKKASKCVSQLSSDFEEKKDQSFTDQSDHKKILEFLKKEDLRKIKEEKRRHKEYLKNEKENRIIRQKLSQTSKKVFERQALSDWARKHKIRTYGKSTKEIKQLKIDYEIKQIKKEGRRERLKLKTQRRESLKKKFEADFLKANPPQTKLEMAIEAVKETFSSYWNKTKSFFGRVFFGEFAVAYGGGCAIIDDSHHEKEILSYLDSFIRKITVIDNQLDQVIITHHNSIACQNLHDFLNGPENLDRVDSHASAKFLELIYQLSKKVGKAVKWLDLLILAGEKIEDYNPVANTIDTLCNQLQDPIKKLKHKYHVTGSLSPSSLKDILDNTDKNNIYHILAYYRTLNNYRYYSIPAEIKNFLSAYKELMKTNTETIFITDQNYPNKLIQYITSNTSIEIKDFPEIFAMPFVITYLIKDGTSNEFNEYNLKDGEKYKLPLSVAVDELIKAVDDDDLEGVRFYERYIVSLIKIISNINIGKYYQFEHSRTIGNFAEYKIGELINSAEYKNLKVYLNKIYDCFK